jgi:hypothetical protein
MDAILGYALARTWEGRLLLCPDCIRGLQESHQVSEEGFYGTFSLEIQGSGSAESSGGFMFQSGEKQGILVGGIGHQEVILPWRYT